MCLAASIGVGVYFWCYIVLLFFMIYEFGSCESEMNYENTTKAHYHRYNNRFQPITGTRMPRLFSFEANDGDVKVDLEFVVPFFRIPIKRSMEVTGNAFRSLVNLNGASLIVSGLFVLVAAFVGMIFNSATRPFTLHPHGFSRKNARMTNDDGVSSFMDPFKLSSMGTTADGLSTKFVTELSDLMGMIDTKLRDDEVSLPACIQKMICELVKLAAEDVQKGQGTATNKIIDGLASLNYVQDYLSGTAVKDAIDAAHSNVHCKYVYYNCKFANPQSALIEMVLSYFRRN